MRSGQRNRQRVGASGDSRASYPGRMRQISRVTGLIVLGAVAAFSLAGCVAPVDDETPSAASEAVDTEQELQGLIERIDGVTAATVRQGMTGEYNVDLTLDEPQDITSVAPRIQQVVEEESVAEMTVAYAAGPENVAADRLSFDLAADRDPEDDAVYTGIRLWADNVGREGARLDVTATGRFISAAFSVTFDGLDAGLRPSALTEQFRNDALAAGADSSVLRVTSTLPNGKDDIRQNGLPLDTAGTSLDVMWSAVADVVGDSATARRFVLLDDRTLRLVLVPAVDDDGTLLPVTLTSADMAALRETPGMTGAAQQGWTLESVTVYTDDGTETFS